MKPLAYSVAFAAALLLPGLAHANSRTIADRRDTRGALDIQSVREAYSGSRVTHAVRMYKPFSSRLLTHGTAVAFGFDLNDDMRTDSLALVVWSQGALRAVLADMRGNPIARLRASRPDRRTVTVSIPEQALGIPVRYRWLALALFKGKPGCQKGCTDVAPNRSLAIHQLAEPAALTVDVTGSGRVSGGQLHQIGCPSTCRAIFRRGSDVPLTASAAAGWEFAGWSGACSGTASTCTVPMDESTWVTATFVPAAALTVSANGSGTVTVNPPGVGCSAPTPCTFRYVTGSTVTISASAAPGMLFDHWGGACSGTTPICVVTLNGSTSVSAVFVPRLSTILVSLDLRNGATGRVTSNPAGIDCPGDCNELFPEGSSVTLTQVAGPGSTFTGWNGSNSRDPSILLIVGLPFPGDRIVTATFER